MSDYLISEIYPSDKRSLAQIDRLLVQEGIRRDGNLDYICAMEDSDGTIIATGSCFGPTLRCFAVSRDHQGEGLLNEIVSHLMEVQYARGNLHLFMYTKVSSAKFFESLGFYEIARVDGTLVFMENRKTGFSGYLKGLEKTRREGLSAALVMNANPFTLGHQYLAETAAAGCDTLRKETRIAAHYLDKEDAVVARSGVAYLVNALNDGVESGVVANGIIRTVEVVVNSARQANAGDVILLCKCQGAGK